MLRCLFPSVHLPMERLVEDSDIPDTNRILKATNARVSQLGVSFFDLDRERHVRETDA